jgi:Rod binding domain-containing protein
MSNAPMISGPMMSAPTLAPIERPALLAAARADAVGDTELRKTFDQFVGEAFYGQMMKSMRKTVGQAAYFHGGRGEEVFREHLDQILSQEMAKSNAADFSGAMFEQFSQLTRRP